CIRCSVLLSHTILCSCKFYACLCLCAWSRIGTYMVKYGFGVHELYISGNFAVRSKYVTMFQ
ncbi:unnamed protein product, partial [Callosobruchus maculatus]